MVKALRVDVLVPRTVLFQIEAHLFPYLRNDFLSKRVGAFKRKFRFLRSSPGLFAFLAFQAVAPFGPDANVYTPRPLAAM
jgi:hypothetical protein